MKSTLPLYDLVLSFIGKYKSMVFSTNHPSSSFPVLGYHTFFIDTQIHQAERRNGSRKTDLGGHFEFGSSNFGPTQLTFADADTVLLACRNFLLGKEDGDIEEVGQEGGEGEHEDEENGDEEEVRLEGVEEEGVEMDGLASGQNDDDMTVDATVHDDDVGIDTDCTVVEREREGSDNESSNIVPTEIFGCKDEENLFISDIAEICKVGISSLLLIYLKLTSSA